MLLAIISLFFLESTVYFDLYSNNVFYICVVLFMVCINWYNPVQHINWHNSNFCLTYFFNKFFIKSFTKFLLNLVNYKYINLFLNFSFKWAPLFKRTSYFGLYNFSKNK